MSDTRGRRVRRALAGVQRTEPLFDEMCEALAVGHLAKSPRLHVLARRAQRRGAGRDAEDALDEVALALEEEGTQLDEDCRDALRA